jgi:Holliday junction resolvasome RuvABC endonuclease subunit
MSVVKILAFDPGTANMGYSELVGDTLTKKIVLTSVFGTLHTKKWDGDIELKIRDRIDDLGRQIRQGIEIAKPTHVAMEDFVEQGKLVGKTYKEMAYLTEHMRILTRELGVPATIYPNGDWKKKTMNARRATKQQVQHYVSHKLPETIILLAKEADHVWDSVGIGYCLWLDILDGLNNRGNNNDEGTAKRSTNNSTKSKVARR